jgi:hypothetical protein
MKVLFRNKKAYEILPDDYVAADGEIVKDVTSDSEWLSRWILDDNGDVADKYEGKTELEALALERTEQIADNLTLMKSNAIARVKDQTGKAISAIDWKVTRATERDAANGTSTLNDVYAEREALRTASDAREVAVNAATTVEELDSI